LRVHPAAASQKLASRPHRSPQVHKPHGHVVFRRANDLSRSRRKLQTGLGAVDEDILDAQSAEQEGYKRERVLRLVGRAVSGGSGMSTQHKCLRDHDSAPRPGDPDELCQRQFRLRDVKQCSVRPRAVEPSVGKRQCGHVGLLKGDPFGVSGPAAGLCHGTRAGINAHHLPTREDLRQQRQRILAGSAARI
jgi:hypothetical protein